MEMPGKDVAIHLRVPILKTLLAMWRQAGRRGNFRGFLTETLEAICADYRLQTHLSPGDRPIVQVEIDPLPATDPRFRRVTPEKVHKILSMRFALTEKEIGQRVGLSQSTVHRILAGHRRREKEAAD